MTTTQRPRTPRRTAPPPGPNPAARGWILVAVGVVLGLILLVKGGGIGFDSSGSGVKIATGDQAGSSTTVATTTTPPTTIQPAATVQVVAANGSKVSGLAGKTGAFLAQSGYSQVVTTDSLQPVQASVLYYAPGYEGNAQAMAKLLNLQPTQVQALPAGAKLAKNQPATAGLVLLIGPETAGVVGVTTGSTGSSTTVAGGATAPPTTVAKGATATTVFRTTTTVRSGVATTTTTIKP
jgi:hypothetical protein